MLHGVAIISLDRIIHACVNDGRTENDDDLDGWVPMSAMTDGAPDGAISGCAAETPSDHCAHHAASPGVPRAALPTVYAGSFGAFVGIAIADIVYPLLILGITGKPLLAGLFGAIQLAALTLASIPAGSFADRHDRRRTLIGVESVRAAVATVLAVSLAGGHVSLVELYLTAAVLGACQPFGGVRTLALRTLAPPERLLRVLAVQQVVGATAQLVGPALGTLLYSISRSLPFAATAVAMAVSALCAVLVRFDGRPKPPPVPAPAAETDAAVAAGRDRSADGRLAGLGIVARSPVMRSALVFIMLVNTVAVPLDLVVIVRARAEGVPTHYLGLILACGAAGGLLGAPLVPRLHALLRPGSLLSGFGLVVTLACAAMAPPFGGFVLAAGFLAIGLVIPAVQVLMDVLILQQVPDHQRGRVLGAAGTLFAVGTPLGAMLGGTLLQITSATGVLCGVAGSLGLVTLFAAAQRDLRRAEWPLTTR
jgi:MFS family permease